MPGFRTEQRAQIKAVNAAEKNFRKLITDLESQFEQIKTQMPEAKILTNLSFLYENSNARNNTGRTQTN